MSEEPVQSNNNEPPHSDVECGVCGRDGGPVVGCEICNGNQTFAVNRHFTLTEERQGMNKEEKEGRYGPGGAVGPKIANLPGSFNPFGSQTNK